MSRVKYFDPREHGFTPEQVKMIYETRRKLQSYLREYENATAKRKLELEALLEEASSINKKLDAYRFWDAVDKHKKKYLGDKKRKNGGKRREDKKSRGVMNARNGCVLATIITGIFFVLTTWVSFYKVYKGDGMPTRAAPNVASMFLAVAAATVVTFLTCSSYEGVSFMTQFGALVGFIVTFFILMAIHASKNYDAFAMQRRTRYIGVGDYSGAILAPGFLMIGLLVIIHDAVTRLKDQSVELSWLVVFIVFVTVIIGSIDYISSWAPFALMLIAVALVSRRSLFRLPLALITGVCTAYLVFILAFNGNTVKMTAKEKEAKELTFHLPGLY